jgi:hypothetical protein
VSGNLPATRSSLASQAGDGWRIIAAIIRKDLTVLWPLVVIVVLLPLLRSDVVLQGLSNDNLRAGTIGVSVLATMLLVVAVVHQDASASLRDDWLTRPIPRWTMVAAKLVFIAAVVWLPAMATSFVSALAGDYPAGEAVARATSVGYATLGAILAVVAFAAVTSTLLEAAGALVAFMVAAIVVQAVSGSVLPDGKGTLVAGAEWLSFAPAISLPLVIAVPVLWLQYGQRRTLPARALVAGACSVALVPVLTTPPAMFSVQRLLNPSTDAVRTAGAALAPGCFPRIATETESGDITDAARRLWDGDQRAKAGPRPIAFSTTVAPSGVPAGWKAMIGFAQAFFSDANGRILHRLQGANAVFGRPDGIDASTSATHFWLASRHAYEEAARQSAGLRLNYFVSLLEPTVSTEIGVHDARQHVPGFGYCSAGPDASPAAISIDCFLRGRRPALLTARWSGETAAREVMTRPDYTPAALEILGGAPSHLSLSRPRGSTASRVTLTAYEARAHAEMVVDAPGLLGGPSCSASVPSTATPTENNHDIRHVDDRARDRHRAPADCVPSCHGRRSGRRHRQHRVETSGNSRRVGGRRTGRPARQSGRIRAGERGARRPGHAADRLPDRVGQQAVHRRRHHAAGPGRQVEPRRQGGQVSGGGTGGMAGDHPPAFVDAHGRHRQRTPRLRSIQDPERRGPRQERICIAAALCTGH